MTRTSDLKELAGAVAITIAGLIVAGYAWLHYPMGSPAEMGPGFFPVALGVIMVVIGLLLAVPAFLRNGAFPAVEWKPLLAVMLSGASFALTIDWLGLAPAVLGLTLIVRAADEKYDLVGSLVLAAALTLLAVLIFRVGLNMPFAIIRGVI